MVTGANVGLGRATTEALVERGDAVVLACRSEERARPALDALSARPGADVSFLRLDLADLRDVERAASEYLASGRRLDVLVNNAGVAGGTGLTRDGFDVTIGTNHVGPFHLTRLLLPRLLESPEPRVVNVSSGSHLAARRIDWGQLHRPAAGVRDRLRNYATSKLMNVLHARGLARRHGARLVACSLHPGSVDTEIWRRLPSPLRGVVRLFLIPVEDGVQTIVHCANAADIESGAYYARCAPARVNPLALDDALVEEVFERTEEAVRAALG